MPTFIKLPSGRIIAPAHIIMVRASTQYDVDGVAVILSSGDNIFFDASDAAALMAWLKTVAVWLEAEVEA